MARMMCIAAVLTGDVALAARTTPRHAKKVSHASLLTLPMHSFKEDCMQMRPIASLIQYPGAGMDPTAGPYATVLKDGYFHVDCVKDYMFLHGDKHGDNKYSYELGEISNVSIVHYSSAVVKEDRQPMTHDICFAFCRTVPDMLFFGITNGRECYCMPYYKPMASDSSQCDAVCEGQTTLMCGGKTKSSVFEMHQCQSTASDLSDAAQKLTDVESQMSEVLQKVLDASELMQTFGDELKKSFGAKGDVAAAGLMQSAVVFAGKLASAVEKAKALLTEGAGLTKKQLVLGSANFEDIAATAEAEDIISKMEQLAADEEAMTEELQALEAQAVAKSDTTKALAQYYETMYFVNKTKMQLVSTCGGDLAAPPTLATSEECAAACDKVNAALLQLDSRFHAGNGRKQGGQSQLQELNERVGGCVGFSIFETAYGKHESEKDLCFLFSKLTSLTYYSECGEEAALPGPELLQQAYSKKKAMPHGTACMAKLQYFEGTTLAPDGSGKCDKCLKKVTPVSSCPSHLPQKI